MNREKKVVRLIVVIFVVLSVSCSSMMSSNQEPTLTQECVETSFIDIKNLDVEGTIAFQDSLSGGLILQNIRTGQEQEFEGAITLLSSVSPDNKHLAYTNDLAGNLIILSSQGVQSVISVKENWNGVVDWVDTTSLLLNEFPEGDPFQKFKIATSSIVYDINTNEWFRLPSDYSGIRISVPTVAWGNFSYTRTVYNSSFSRVVFPASDEQNQPVLVLWDNENGQEISRFYQGYDNSVGGPPQWSHSGDFFIAGIYPNRQKEDSVFHQNVPDNVLNTGGFDLFRVDSTGGIKRLTRFTEDYMAGLEAYVLSPDEKSVVFWLDLEYKPGSQSANRTLAILNIETGRVVDLCFSDGGKTPIPPVWSPDGRYILVSRYSPKENKQLLSDSILIDVEKKTAMLVKDNLVGIGWLDE